MVSRMLAGLLILCVSFSGAIAGQSNFTDQEREMIEERLLKVRNSVVATSETQWLPMWSALASRQLLLLESNPGMDIGTAFRIAYSTVKPSYVWGWDDGFWCRTSTPYNIKQSNDDVRFDYCKSISDDDELYRYDNKYDPRTWTYYGNLLWIGDNELR